MIFSAQADLILSDCTVPAATGVASPPPTVVQVAPLVLIVVEPVPRPEVTLVRRRRSSQPAATATSADFPIQILYVVCP